MFDSSAPRPSVDDVAFPKKSRSTIEQDEASETTEETHEPVPPPRPPSPSLPSEGMLHAPGAIVGDTENETVLLPQGKAAYMGAAKGGSLPPVVGIPTGPPPPPASWAHGTGPQPVHAPHQPMSPGRSFPVAHAPIPPPAPMPMSMGMGPVPTSKPSKPPRPEDDSEIGSRRGGAPGSFSRIFLGNVEKYREKSGNVGTASQEAAAVIAQASSPEEGKRAARGATLRLRSPLALVETLVLTLMVPAIGWLANHDDPFFLEHRFSWVVVAPILLGLRHGFAPALASAVVLDGLIAVAWRTKIVPIHDLPGETMIGLAALAMVTGQFSDVWKRELVRLDGGFEVLRKQLGEVMRAHFLLELSHDRLEERMGKGTPNLRDALVAVHRVAATRAAIGGAATLSDVADPMVDILATYTMIEVGSIHRVDAGRVVPEPVAKIGRPAPLDPNDEQVKEAVRTKKLTYIRGGASLEASSQRTKVLAAVPFVDAHGTLRGVLTVESIPLLAFERRNLETLAILGGRFADVIATGGQEAGVQEGQRKELQIRLRRAIRDLVENDVASTLYVLLVRRGSAASDSIESILGGSLRALDFPYVAKDAQGNYVIYILLPLTDEAGARAFAARLERIVQLEASMTLARAGGFTFHHVLRTDDTVEDVMRRLDGMAKIDEGSVEHTIVV